VELRDVAVYGIRVRGFSLGSRRRVQRRSLARGSGRCSGRCGAKREGRRCVTTLLLSGWGHVTFWQAVGWITITLPHHGEAEPSRGS